MLVRRSPSALLLHMNSWHVWYMICKREDYYVPPPLGGRWCWERRPLARLCLFVYRPSNLSCSTEHGPVCCVHSWLLLALSLKYFMSTPLLKLSLLVGYCFPTPTTGTPYHHQHHREGRQSRRLPFWANTWLRLTLQTALVRRRVTHNAFAHCCNKSAVF